MNGFDPGPGWREIQYGIEAEGRESLHWKETGLVGGQDRLWIREEPVPPLPSEPHTVILTRGKPGWDNWELKLDGDGKLWRSTNTQAVFDPDELPRLITGFEVLAVPAPDKHDRFAEQQRDEAMKRVVRRKTAKAVLDRVRDEGILRNANAHDVADEIAREFGLSS